MDIIRRDINPSKTLDEVTEWINNKIQRFDKDGAVIGLSGGVDSTVTAWLTKHAFVRNKNDYKLITYNLPTKINDQQGIDRTKKMARHYDIDLEIVPVQHISDSWECLYRDMLDSDTHENTRAWGNMVARVRANMLHTIAEDKNYMVIGTGNYDEDMNLGYYTLFGDGAVHISPIGSLTKRHVYELAAYLNMSRFIPAQPSAELEPGQTDFKDLGYSYGLAEIVCCGICQGLTNKQIQSNKFVHNRALNELNVYKEEFGELKHDTILDIIQDIRERKHLALKKVQLVNPDFPWIKHREITIT